MASKTKEKKKLANATIEAEAATKALEAARAKIETTAARSSLSAERAKAKKLKLRQMAEIEKERQKHADLLASAEAHQRAKAAAEAEEKLNLSRKRSEIKAKRLADRVAANREKRIHTAEMNRLRQEERATAAAAREERMSAILAAREDVARRSIERRQAVEKARADYKQHLAEIQQMKEDARKKRMADRKPSRPGIGAFGGFAFGTWPGILDALGNAGPAGVAAGSFGIAASTGGSAFLGLAAAMTAASGVAVKFGQTLLDVFEESVSFGQQTTLMIGALVNDDPAVTRDTSRYLQRELARQTPLDNRQTMLMFPQLASLGYEFKEANILTQLSSDVAFGLNPGDSTKAGNLMRKLIQDITSKGYYQNEEARQAANLGLPMGMVEKAIMKQWNSAEFQKLNPSAGLLKSTADVKQAISDKRVGSNMALNAIMEVSNTRLGRNRVGEYSQYATENTIAGLMSQLRGIPVEIADTVANGQGMSATNSVMSLLRDATKAFSGTKQGRIAYAADSGVSAFLGSAKGFASGFTLDTFIYDILAGLQSFDWQAFGKFVGEALQWTGKAFVGLMHGLELARPRIQEVLSSFMSWFENPQKIARTTNAMLQLATAVANLGSGLIQLIASFGEVVTYISGDGGSPDASAVGLVGAASAAIANPQAAIAKQLGEGLAVFAQNAAEQGKAAAEELKEAFKFQMGIHSPSTVMRAYGNDMSEGLELGFTGLPAAQSAVEELKKPVAGLTSLSFSAPLPLTQVSTETSKPSNVEVTVNVYGSNQNSEELARLVIARIKEEIS